MLVIYFEIKMAERILFTYFIMESYYASGIAHDYHMALMPY